MPVSLTNRAACGIPVKKLGVGAPVVDIDGGDAANKQFELTGIKHRQVLLWDDHGQATHEAVTHTKPAGVRSRYKARILQAR